MTENDRIEFTIMKEDINHIKTDIGELKSTLKEFIETSEGRFAGKWVEKALFWILMTAGGVIITYFIKTILELKQ